MVRNAFRDRQKSDYETFIEFSKIEVDSMFEDMKLFVSEIELHIKSHL